MKTLIAFLIAVLASVASIAWADDAAAAEVARPGTAQLSAMPATGADATPTRHAERVSPARAAAPRTPAPRGQSVPTYTAPAGGSPVNCACVFNERHA